MRNIEHRLLSGNLLSYYAEWCSVVKPRVAGVAYLDSAFLYDTAPAADAGAAPSAIPAAAMSTQPVVRIHGEKQRKQLYVGIPHNILGGTDPTLRAAMDRVHEFYARTFWANNPAYRTHLAALALAKRGLNIDMMFFYWGRGGVGLSLTSHHLACMLGDANHKYFDPQVFYIEGEMRILVSFQTFPRCVVPYNKKPREA